MRRVLVTGLTGFIGRQSIQPLIERGFEVHALFKGEPLDDARVRWHEADLLDLHQIEKVCADVGATHLLHFAWYVAHADYKTSPENMKWVAATVALLKAFTEGGGVRATLAGTCMEYDWSVPQDFLSEHSSPLHPTTPYGAAKNETRIRSEEFSKKNGLSLAWGRIFLLFGPHEAPARLVPHIINSLLKNEPALLTRGEQVRDIMYVKDVADAFVALLDSDVTGVVNIGSGEPVALKDVALKIGAMLGKPDLIHLGAKQSTDEPARLVFDVRRLRDKVGWKPHFTLEQGLEETIAWWKANKA